MRMRPTGEMRLIALPLLVTLVLAACAQADEDPGEEPTTTSAATSTDPPSSVTSSGLDEDATDDVAVDVEPVAESDDGDLSDDTGNGPDGRPGQTKDPEVEVPDLPAPTLVRPKTPNTEPVVPPPRD